MHCYKRVIVLNVLFGLAAEGAAPSEPLLNNASFSAAFYFNLIKTPSDLAPLAAV